MAYLKIIGGPEAGQTRELVRPKTIVGRHPDCHVAVEHLDASRHHAQILFVGNELFLEDLHSRNGTFLNKRRLQQRTKLSPGDQIRISGTVFEFHPGDTPTEPDTPPVVVDQDDSSRVEAVAPPVGASGAATARPPSALQAELSALLEITQNLRQTLALDEVLPQILDTLFRIFPSAERGLVVLQAEDGAMVPRWVKFRQGPSDQEIRISSTILKRVMETQQAVLSANAAEDSRFRASESISLDPIRSVMCAPLVDGAGRSFGVLQLDAPHFANRFQAEDLRVLLAVATQASIAIDNAHLHEKALSQRTIERDLELADEIQRSFLPTEPPVVPGYEFFDFYKPATYVGGDFYDYLFLPDGRMAVVVADVVGHGLAAAMITAKLAGEVRYRLLTTPHAADALTQLNRSFPRGLGVQHFITLVLAVLQPDSGELTLVNAGHRPPILRLPDGRVSDVVYEESGVALGILDDCVYEQTTLTLPRGGLLLLYTDGIDEAMNHQKELYGPDRVRRQVEMANSGPHQLGHYLISDVREFVQGAPQADDMCLVCFRRN